jgi:hypothetical protein
MITPRGHLAPVVRLLVFHGTNDDLQMSLLKPFTVGLQL